MPKRLKRKCDAENVAKPATPSSSESCNKAKKRKAKKRKANETVSSIPFAEIAEITVFDTLIPPVLHLTQNSKVDKCKMHTLIQTEGSKYNLLYKAMISDIKFLSEGYKCLQLFRNTEVYYRKSKSHLACTKAFKIGRVKFVMRKQFNKTQAKDAITPMRFASVVTLAADKVFREKLLLDPTAMQTAFETITNAFGIVHGFAVNCIPETNDQKKLFYYYLVTTISMQTLFEINPISCSAIAKWRLEGDHFKRLGLDNKALDIDETYARCLSGIKATAKYVIESKSSRFQFKPEDLIDNQVVMNKIMEEFSFLKRCAAKPGTKRACRA